MPGNSLPPISLRGATSQPCYAAHAWPEQRAVNIIGAIIGYVLGVLLGFILLISLINVAAWSWLALVPALLPPPFDQLVLALLAVQAFNVGALIAVSIVIITLTFAVYWIASTGIVFPTPRGLVTTTGAERFGRGSLIGFNAGINNAILLTLLAAVPGGIFVAFALTLLGLAACVLTISNNAIYQVVLAYGSLFMPMAAPMNAVGALCLALNTVAIAFGVSLSIIIDWRRANIIMHGGFIHGCQRTAFNMANFTVAHPEMSLNDPWVSPGTPMWPVCPAGFDPAGPRRRTVNGVVIHEAAHTLNVAAFGWIYHLVGFADQWAPMPWSGGVILGADAHSELSAESALRGARRNWLDMWAPSLAGAPIGNATAIAVVAAAPAAGVVVVVPPATALVGVSCERNRGVELDSSASVDPDAAPMPLGRLWLIEVRPPRSAAAVPGPNAPAITYVPDVGGLYRLEFHLTDGESGGPGGVDGALAIELDVLEALIAPTAVPLTPGANIDLDGFTSIVPTLGATGVPTFAWNVLQVPPVSGVATGPAGAASIINLTPDRVGVYEVELSVSQTVQPAAGGAAVTLTDVTRVLLTVETLRAVITAEPASFAPGEPIVLNADASVVFVVADADAPGFQWRISGLPLASALTPGDAGTDATFSFTPDVAGDYLIELTVTQNVTPANGGAAVSFTNTAQTTLTVA